VEECIEGGEKKIKERDFGREKSSKDGDQLIFRSKRDDM
jgi:hypothetical protein